MSDTLPLLPGLRRRLLSPFLKSLPPYSWKPAYKPFVPVHDPKPGSPASWNASILFSSACSQIRKIPDLHGGRLPKRIHISGKGRLLDRQSLIRPPGRKHPHRKPFRASSGQKTLPLTFDATRGCPRDRRWCREASRRTGDQPFGAHLRLRKAGIAKLPDLPGRPLV